MYQCFTKLRPLWPCNCNLPLPAVSMHGVATGISKTSNMEIRTREQRIQVFSIGRVSTFTLWHHRRSETKNITNMIVNCNIKWFLAMYKYCITHNIWCKKNSLYILVKSKWPILLKVPQLKIYWCTQVASSRHTYSYTRHLTYTVHVDIQDEQSL